MASNGTEKVRYAVVGLGHIAQAAILPSFEHASNAELVALVSGDDNKLRRLGEIYGVSELYSYDRYDELLASEKIDAVYIALPNHMHHDFAVRAAKAHVHVLCEKPLAVTSEQCREMVEEARRNGVRLMTAYRLHFERTNLEAMEIARSGILGDTRLFQAQFTMTIKEGDIRWDAIEKGGGTLFDIGTYCINAARCVFRAEPIEVLARCAFDGAAGWEGTDARASVMLRFPGDRLASFETGFREADQSTYSVVGTEGIIRVEPAFHWSRELAYELIAGERTSRRKVFKRRDQFAAVIVYFSDCIMSHRDPEPDGLEGLADVRVIEAAYRSAIEEAPISLEPFLRKPWPTLAQEIRLPPVRKTPEEIHVSSPRER